MNEEEQDMYEEYMYEMWEEEQRAMDIMDIPGACR